MRNLVPMLMILSLVLCAAATREEEPAVNLFKRRTLNILIIDRFAGERNDSCLFGLRRNSAPLLEKRFPKRLFLLTSQGRDPVHPGFHKAVIALGEEKEAVLLYSLEDAAKYVSQEEIAVQDEAAALETKDLLLAIIVCTPIRVRTDLPIDRIHKTTVAEIDAKALWKETVEKTTVGWKVSCIYFVLTGDHPIIERSVLQITAQGKITLEGTMTVYQSIYIQ